MRWLGPWRARAPSNGRDITVQALLTGSHVPHPELVLVDSGNFPDPDRHTATNYTVGS
jgi:hypothetical protein